MDILKINAALGGVLIDLMSDELEPVSEDATSDDDDGAADDDNSDTDD